MQGAIAAGAVTGKTGGGSLPHLFLVLNCLQFLRWPIFSLTSGPLHLLFPLPRSPA